MTLISILIKKLEPNIKQREKKLVVEEIAVNKRSSENREQKKRGKKEVVAEIAVKKKKDMV